MKQAGGDKDKDKGDKKGDGKPKVLKLCDVTDLCGFCGAGSCKFKCAKCHLVSYCSDQCQFRDITKHQPHCKSLEEQAHHRALNEAFLKACSTGILRLVKTMLDERGADANYVGPEQCTPLIAASQGGHVPVVEALIAADSRVEYARRKDGYTALLAACEYGHVEVVRILLRAGADPNQAYTDESAHTPLIQASIRGFVQIVDELISAGANVNYASPNDGSTSLMFAAEDGFVDVVRSLLAAGADPRTARHSGHTALDAALHCNHPAIAALLKAKIAELSGST